MTPAARIAAAIDLLEVVEGAPKRPADAVANDFFRSRRYIGSGDRRAVSERVWRVLRTAGGWAGGWATRNTPRLLVAASLLLEGWTQAGVRRHSPAVGSRGAAGPCAKTGVLARIEGHTIDHPTMPDAVRLEMPDWLFPRLRPASAPAWRLKWRRCREPASLDLRVNLLKGGREQARAALAAEGWEAAPTRFSPWGLRIDGRRPVTSGPGISVRPGRDPGRGQPICRRPGRGAARHAGGGLVRRARAARPWHWPG